VRPPIFFNGIVFPVGLRSSSPPSGTPLGVFPILNFLTAGDELDYINAAGLGYTQRRYHLIEMKGQIVAIGMG